MITNGSCTVYNRIGKTEAYTRIFTPACMWQDVSGYTVQKYGTANANKATVFIPLTVPEPQKDSLILRGECTLEIDGTTHKSSELLPLGALKIVTVDKNDFGSPALQHWEVGAK